MQSASRLAPLLRTPAPQLSLLPAVGPKPWLSTTTSAWWRNGWVPNSFWHRQSLRRLLSLVELDFQQGPIDRSPGSAIQGLDRTCSNKKSQDCRQGLVQSHCPRLESVGQKGPASTSERRKQKTGALNCSPVFLVQLCSPFLHYDRTSPRGWYPKGDNCTDPPTSAT